MSASDAQKIEGRVKGKLLAHCILAPIYKATSEAYYERWMKSPSDANLMTKWIDALGRYNASVEIIKVLEDVLKP